MTPMSDDAYDAYDFWLDGIDLHDAYLDEADISDTSLKAADLSGASLRRATLDSSNLTAASLRATTLLGANLTATKLVDTDMSGAVMGDTLLLRVDLSTVRGLHLVEHRFPSIIDTTTLEQTIKGARSRVAQCEPIVGFLDAAGVSGPFTDLVRRRILD